MSFKRQTEKQFEEYLRETIGLGVWLASNKAEAAAVGLSTSKWFVKNVTTPLFIAQATGLAMQVGALTLQSVGLTTSEDTTKFYDVTNQGELHGFGWLVQAPQTYFRAGMALGEATQDFNIFANASTIIDHYF
jgi:hypothetical protein